MINDFGSDNTWVSAWRFLWRLIVTVLVVTGALVMVCSTLLWIGFILWSLLSA